MTRPCSPTPRQGRATRSLAALVAASFLAIVAAGCTGSAGSSSGSLAPLPSAAPSAGAPSDAPASEPPAGVVPQVIIDNAVADAADRAGVEPAAVTVVSTEAQDWPNGGLGCPEPGMMYAEVITPGYRVVVEANGVEYDYRASSQSSDVRWCENPPPAT